MAATGTQDLVMVGDTTYDLEMAKAAGVKAIGVSWGHHSIERLNKWAPVVHSVDELQRELGSDMKRVHALEVEISLGFLAVAHLPYQ